MKIIIDDQMCSLIILMDIRKHFQPGSRIANHYRRKNFSKLTEIVGYQIILTTLILMASRIPAYNGFEKIPTPTKEKKTRTEGKEKESFR